MRIKLSELRQIIRETIADTMVAPGVSAHTELPPDSGRAYHGPAADPSMRGDQVLVKANQVSKIVSQKMNSNDYFQQVKQFVAQMDPQERLVKTAQQIAQDFLGTIQQN